MTARYLSHLCAQCGEARLFRFVERGDRRRMICSECGTELPAREGPVADWRELVEGQRIGEQPDDGRRQPG